MSRSWIPSEVNLFGAIIFTGRLKCHNSTEIDFTPSSFQYRWSVCFSWIYRKLPGKPLKILKIWRGCQFSVRSFVQSPSINRDWRVRRQKQRSLVLCEPEIIAGQDKFFHMSNLHECDKFLERQKLSICWYFFNQDSRHLDTQT